jgi:pyruvate/2-oxoglutarate dehydrogenase complex dihydrolipoamide acyltransferase (E2) component
MPDVPGVGPFRMVPFRPERNATIDTLRWARKRLLIPVLLEVDVTAARSAIREFRRRTGRGLSFTAWLVSCVAKAAAEHPRVHSVRRGSRKLVLFEDVDVAVLVERAIGGEAERETLPMPAVIRQAHRKSLAEIHEEVRRAQETSLRGGSSIADAPPPWLQALFFRLPAWLRDLLFWRWLLRSPSRVKRTMGTVVVTSVGMAAPGVLTWGIPLSLHPLAVAVGGIARRTTATGAADMLALTVVFDHAVTDGAPVGRFVHRLHELISRAEGLGEIDASDGSVRGR